MKKIDKSYNSLNTKLTRYSVEIKLDTNKLKNLI